MKLTELYSLGRECILIEDNLWEMANLTKTETGLPYYVYVSSKRSVNGQHGPRIKVSNVPNSFSANDNFVVSISRMPEVMAGKPKMSENKLGDIKDWVIFNYIPLMKYWNDEYSISEFLNDLQKL